MKTNIAIGVVLFVSCYLLFVICKYWYADTKFASGQRSQGKDLAGAYENLTEAVQYNPDEPAILSEYAISAAYVANATQNKDFAQQAINLASRAIAVSPHHPNYYKSMTRSLILISDVEPQALALAAEVLTKAAVLSPTDPRIPHNQAVIAKYLGKLDEAKVFAQRALDLKPDFGDARKLLQN